MDTNQTMKPAVGLDEILGSTTRVRVARLLIELPDKEFTGREIARLLGKGHSTILPALRLLVDGGLISERVVGRAHAFRANKEHFLNRVLAAAFGSERRLVREIEELIRLSLAGDARSVVLFGSRARGVHSKGSDIDLLIVPKEGRNPESVLRPLRTRLRRRYGVELDAKVLSPARLRSKADRAYVKAARAEGITLAGVPLEEVTAGDD